MSEEQLLRDQVVRMKQTLARLDVLFQQADREIAMWRAVAFISGAISIGLVCLLLWGGR